MSISELISRFGTTMGAEVGVVVFAAVFAVLTARLWSRRRQAALEEARALPFSDDDVLAARGREP
jgi:hypothetical protein